MVNNEWYHNDLDFMMAREKYRIISKEGYLIYSIKDADKLIGKVIVRYTEERPSRFSPVNQKYSKYLITGVEEDGVYIGSGNKVSFKTLREQYTFIDGTPCAKKVGA